MEKNTIILSVEDYNEMRDFNENVKANNAVSVFWNWNKYQTRMYTQNEAVIEIAKANESLKEKIEELKNPDKKQPSIDEIKAMSWRKFRKWKKGGL